MIPVKEPHVRRAATAWPLAAVLMGALAMGTATGCSSSSPGSELAFPSDPIATVTSQAGRLRIAMYTAPKQPPSRGVITVKLAVTDALTGSAVDGLSFDIAPEMPSMAHGTPLVPRVSGKGGGIYVAENVDLFMAGSWDLPMTITGTVSDAANVTIEVS
jgi:hypothetical protein